MTSIYRPATSSEIRELDRLAIEEFGLPGIELMMNAGKAAVDVAVKMLRPDSAVTIVCGKGNNGGDGFVMGRLLRDRGHRVKVFCTHSHEVITGDAGLALNFLAHDEHAVETITRDLGGLCDSLRNSDLAVDALLGTGLKREVVSPMSDVIRALNECGRSVLAVDVPSGLNADTGAVMGVCVKATETITFALSKVGFSKTESQPYLGKLTVAPIGLPDELLEPFRYKTLDE